MLRADGRLAFNADEERRAARRGFVRRLLVGALLVVCTTQARAQLQMQGVTIGSPSRSFSVPPSGAGPTPPLGAGPSAAPASPPASPCEKQADDLQLAGRERADYLASCRAP
jgi:hypothetical protein